MLTQFAESAHTVLPLSPAEAACIFLSDEHVEKFIEPNLEATLAQAAAKNSNAVPGLNWGDPAARCRTWICNCTRAVPHGSFL
jgi:hypothetical protein